MTGELLGGITMAELAANVSAMTCPTGHDNAVPVEDLTGDIVAALCPDCDKQLPVNWAPTLPAFVPDPRLTIRIKE